MQRISEQLLKSSAADISSRKKLRKPHLGGGNHHPPPLLYVRGLIPTKSFLQLEQRPPPQTWIYGAKAHRSSCM